MKRCVRCYEAIQDFAQQCRFCGQWQPPPPHRRGFPQWLTAILCLLVVAFVFWFCKVTGIIH